MNIKYNRILNKVYKEENILLNLSSLFGTQFKKDWIGRIYTVINPIIKDGEYQQNAQIYEYNTNGITNNAYIEHWIMDRLNIAKNFIRAQNLFDLLTYEIKPIDSYGNYLFIIKPITLDDCLEYTKKFLILYPILILIGIFLYIYIF